MSEQLTVHQVVAFVRSRGVTVSDDTVTAARRGGLLPASKDQCTYIYEKADVLAWLGEGCPAPRAERPTGAALTSTEIVSMLRERGVVVLDDRVIAARRGGMLRHRREGRRIVSEQDDVLDWAAAGCQAPGRRERVADVEPRLGCMTDMECMAARLAVMAPAARARFVLELQRAEASSRAEADRLRTELGAARNELASMQGEREELEASLAAARRKLARKLHTHN
jgi:hypothetical protein